MADEIKDILQETEETTEPLEVKIKKEEIKEPSFDYDDYTPSDTEILDIETQIAEKIKKATKNG